METATRIDRGRAERRQRDEDGKEEEIGLNVCIRKARSRKESFYRGEDRPSYKK